VKPLHGQSTDDIMPGQRKMGRCYPRFGPPSYAFGAVSSLGFPLQLVGWKIPTELLAILPFLVV